MSTCRVCGKDNPYHHCADCFERYQEDIRTGHIPPQFLEAGVEFEFRDWLHIKVTEKLCANMCLSPEQTRLRVDMACDGRVDLHRREAQPQSRSTQAKQEADARIKKYSVY